MEIKSWNRRLTDLLNRDHLPRWLNLNAPHGTMVEIGTYYGEFALHIASFWRGKLYCVDPWADQPDEDYRDGCANGGVAGGRNPMEPIFEAARDRLLPKGVAIYREFSEQALPRVMHGSLDCVYIDGNHRVECALHDLSNWYGKLRSGGLIGIHDCYIREDAVQRCGVWDSVWEFSHQIKQQAFLTNCSSAWFIKP